jgi:DNA-binding PadR family transcriptional regulator
MEVVADPRTISPRQPPALSGPVRASFVENLVLTLIAAGPTHGFAVARVLGREGEIGRIYEVPRPLVYRAVDRLIEGNLVRPLRVEAGDHGPPRTVVTTTAAGQRTVRKWLATPAEHVRDVRTELVVKLALLQRSDKDPTPLLEAQRVALEPIVTALDAQCELTEGLDHTVALWRYQTAMAALRFVERMLAEPTVRSRRATKPGSRQRKPAAALRSTR